MKRFSRHFWVTVFAGGLSSLLFTLAVVWFFNSKSKEMVALCRLGRVGCASRESLEYSFRVAYLAQAGGTLLLFVLAYHIGRMLTSPALPAPTVAGE
jgi:hypothetical protein